MKKTKDKAKIVIIILAVIAVIAAAGAVYAGMQNKKADKEKEEVSAEPEVRTVLLISHTTGKSISIIQICAPCCLWEWIKMK